MLMAPALKVNIGAWKIKYCLALQLQRTHEAWFQLASLTHYSLSFLFSRPPLLHFPLFFFSLGEFELVFFFTCKSWAAWMRGSRVSLAPLFIKFLSRSHSSSWLTLYLCQKRVEGDANLPKIIINVLIFLCMALLGISVEFCFLNH